jgi:hypothetical protein
LSAAGTQGCTSGFGRRGPAGQSGQGSAGGTATSNG